MHNAATSQGEWKILHDFLNWRRDVRTIEELGAYRTLERNLILGDARPEQVTVAEITASAFRLTRVPPLLGRPLLEADEQPGAPAGRRARLQRVAAPVRRTRRCHRADGATRTLEADRRRRHAGGLRVSA